MSALASPRCSQHREDGPLASPEAWAAEGNVEQADRAARTISRCPTCRRIAVERDIVIRTVDALLAGGYALQVDDGGGVPQPVAPTTDRAAILGALMATDEDYLLAERDGRPRWVRFVYGNDGPDVICDYTVSLEAVLAPVNAYADSLA